MENIVINRGARVHNNKTITRYNLDTVFYEKNCYYSSNLKKLYICYELTCVKSKNIDSHKNMGHKHYLTKIVSWANARGIKLYDLKLSISDFDKILQLYILNKFYCSFSEKQDNSLTKFNYNLMRKAYFKSLFL